MVNETCSRAMGVLAAIVYSVPPALSPRKAATLTKIHIYFQLPRLIDQNNDVVSTNKLI